MLTLILFILVLAVLVTVILQLFKLSRKDPKNTNYTNGITAKILASGILIALAISTAAAIKSLWYAPLNDDYSDKFTYENIATAAGIAAMSCVLILNALQKSAYWLIRKPSASADSKQLQTRREVFERSYRLVALILTVSILWLDAKLWQIPTIMANEHGSVPGHISWIGINLVVVLFGLPLIVGAWKNKQV